MGVERRTRIWCLRASYYCQHTAGLFTTEHNRSNISSWKVKVFASFGLYNDRLRLCIHRASPLWLKQPIKQFYSTDSQLMDAAAQRSALAAAGENQLMKRETAKVQNQLKKTRRVPAVRCTLC